MFAITSSAYKEESIIFHLHYRYDLFSQNVAPLKIFFSAIYVFGPGLSVVLHYNRQGFPGIRLSFLQVLVYLEIKVSHQCHYDMVGNIVVFGALEVLQLPDRFQIIGHFTRQEAPVFST